MLRAIFHEQLPSSNMLALKKNIFWFVGITLFCEIRMFDGVCQFWIIITVRKVILSFQNLGGNSLLETVAGVWRKMKKKNTFYGRKWNRSFRRGLWWSKVVCGGIRLSMFEMCTVSCYFWHAQNRIPDEELTPVPIADLYPRRVIITSLWRLCFWQQDVIVWISISAMVNSPFSFQTIHNYFALKTILALSGTSTSISREFHLQCLLLHFPRFDIPKPQISYIDIFYMCPTKLSFANV